MKLFFRCAAACPQRAVFKIQVAQFATRKFFNTNDKAFFKKDTGGPYSRMVLYEEQLKDERKKKQPAPKPDYLEAHYKAAENQPPPPESVRTQYGIYIEMYTLQRKFDQAAETVQALYDSGADIDQGTYVALLTYYRFTQQSDRAKELVHEILGKYKHIRMELRTYQEITKVLIKRQEFEEAAALRVEMFHLGFFVNREPLNLVKEMSKIGKTKREMWDCRLATMTTRGEFEKCVEIFKDIKTGGPPPSECSYNCMIYWYCKRRGYAAQAEATWNEMISHGYTPNARSFKMRVKMYRRMLDHENAQRVFQEMQEAGHADATMYSWMITFYARNYFVNESEQRRFRARGETPPNWKPGQDLESNIEWAERLYFEMRQDGFVGNSNVYSCMMTMYGVKGDFEQAEKIWEDMLEDGVPPEAKTYFIIAEVYKDCGKKDKAEEVMNKWRQSGVLPPLNKGKIIKFEKLW